MPMEAKITSWHATANCAWCEKDRECVTADFGDGFISHSELCWTCLQKAVKVRSKQDQNLASKPK
ncbi:MAG: hypothetical protein JWM11_6846 [Planctomycetaceae bacterium]|nr:hypothetical protein [Planctomycetaceae bacterium]